MAWQSTGRKDTPTGRRNEREHILFYPVARGIRVHHIILSCAFLLLLLLGLFIVMEQEEALTHTAISSYQQTELEIVRDAARSTREYVYVQTVILNRTDREAIEQEIFKKFIEPIHLLKNGDAWIYAPDHVVFDASSDFPDDYRGRSMQEIFDLQKQYGASHFEAMAADVAHAREGVGYYIWLPEKGAEIAAWTPVRVGNYTWTIGLSTPLPEILEATGASATARTSIVTLLFGTGFALIVFLAWLYADIRRGNVERELRESKERYEAIVRHAPGPVLVLKSGIIRFINEAGLRISGYPYNELVGKDIRDFLTEESRAVARDSTLPGRDNKEVAEFEIEFVTKDKKLLSLIVRTIDIPYENEMVTLALLLDITDRKRSGEALRMANKKLHLLSGITRHDIKNKLLILIGFIGLAKTVAGNKEGLAELFAKQEKAVQAIDAMISFTKDYEDLGMHAPAWQNIHAIIATARIELPRGEICTDTIDPALEIFADPLLERVFYNLIDNALRYGGGRMTTIHISQEMAGEDLKIVVEDNGTGIVPQDKKKLFTKGFGRNTGLGLFLSREILAITGITIEESGEPGRGARFEIRVMKGMFRFSDR